MTVATRSSGHRIRLERLRELGGIDQHDQFVGLVDQLLLGLDESGSASITPSGPSPARP